MSLPKPAPSLRRTPRPRRRLAVVASALLLAPLALSIVVPLAFGGDPAPEAPAPSARLTAVQQEIRHLERHLAGLRKARAELAAGRAEPTPADDVARRVAAADQRALREFARYEAARGKALAKAADAATSSDEAAIEAARAAVEAVDVGFLSAIQKIDDARDAATTEPAKPAASGKRGAARDPDEADGAAAGSSTEKGAGAEKKEKKAGRSAGKSSKSDKSGRSGGDGRGDKGDDADDDDDDADEDGEG